MSREIYTLLNDDQEITEEQTNFVYTLSEPLLYVCKSMLINYEDNHIIDINEQFNLLICAYERNVLESYWRLAEMHNDGKHSLGKNHIKASKILNEGIELGCDTCMNNLGRMYTNNLHPDGVNNTLYIFWLSQSMALGNMYAVCNMGIALEKEKLYNQSHKLYLTAINSNCSYGFYLMGVMYQNGTHPEGKNIVKAFSMYNSAAELNDDDALNIIGFAYDEGDHPDGENIEKAEEYYLKAITYGNVDAIENLDILKQNKRKKMKMFGSFDDECSVCHISLKNIKDGNVITGCGHIFHKECMKDKKCPVCRQEIPGYILTPQ